MLATERSSCTLLQPQGPLAWLCRQVLLKDVYEAPRGFPAVQGVLD